MNKKAKIKKLAIEILKESHKKSIEKVERALNSGAIDIESWDENNGKMLIPKSIVCAILIDESKQYDASGTSFEKKVKKDIKNIGYYL